MRQHVVACKRQMCWNLAGKPQPHGDTQINRNWLICDTTILARNTLKLLAKQYCK